MRSKVAWLVVIVCVAMLGFIRFRMILDRDSSNMSSSIPVVDLSSGVSHVVQSKAIIILVAERDAFTSVADPDSISDHMQHLRDELRISIDRFYVPQSPTRYVLASDTTGVCYLTYPQIEIIYDRHP